MNGRLKQWWVALCSVWVMCWCLTAAAIAQNSRSQNLDAKIFAPSVSPYGLLSTHSSRAMEHLSVYAGLHTNYANDLFLLQLVQGAKVDSFRPVAHRVTAELAVGLGLWEQLDVYLALPVYLRQFSSSFPSGSDPTTGVTGLGDLRWGAKWQAVRQLQESGFGLAIALEFRGGTGSAGQWMRDAPFALLPQIIGDFRLPSGFVVTLNLGAHLRLATEPVDVTLQNGNNSTTQVAVQRPHALTFGVGLEWPLGEQGVSLVGELQSSLALGEVLPGDSLGQRLATEALLAIRWRHRRGVVLSLGGGTGLAGGIGAPDFRVLFNLGFVWGESVMPLAAVRREKFSTPTPPPPIRGPVEKPKTIAVKVPPFQSKRPLSQGALRRLIAQDKDPDGDGILAPQDQCPKRAEDFDGYKDKDGCPDPDNDGDGIPDSVDNCPLKREVINGVDDEDGCPDQGETKVVLKGGKINILEKIFFDSGSDRLKSKSFGILKQLAAFLKSTKRITLIQIEGHTDSQGDKEMNIDLSIRRAQRVKAFLVGAGINGERLTVKGFGPLKPIASNRKASGRAKNRRVVFRVMRQRGEKR